MLFFLLHIHLWSRKTGTWYLEPNSLALGLLGAPRSSGDGKTSWKASTRHGGAHVREHKVDLTRLLTEF